MTWKQHNENSAPGIQFGDQAPTRLHTRSGEQEHFNLSPIERDALASVYRLINEVARRARDEGQVAA